ncbi:MAG: glycosyltransferase family 2 protein [Candidatus Kapaibacterium sp.]
MKGISGYLEQPKPWLYLFIFGAWGLSVAWFHPRMISLLDMATTPLGMGALLFFIIFTEIAWLYAFFNVGVILFGAIYRRRPTIVRRSLAELPQPHPSVAMLYTTCNDFVEESALSCLAQDYEHFTLYILDDSSDENYRCQVDAFAKKHPGRTRVVRRANRKGFKAGNINHGLKHVATSESLFALVDADEILPTDFLTRLVPMILADDNCGFVQANHKSNPESKSRLAQAMGIGIDIHWRWYHPLRNRFGFVMLLGHGAVIRRQCWQEIGGFPELVSEDLAFAIRAREKGWRGFFAEDVICYEDFPEDVRAFRVRHMKWTRGTCEFLAKDMWRVLRSRAIPVVEKFDILFPTLNLPLSLFYFLFIIDANLIITSMFGSSKPLTLAFGGTELTIPIWRMSEQFAILNSADFYAITLLTLLAPILCFIIDMAKKPRKLFRFLSQSTTLYGALGPLSCLGVLFFLLTGKAVFHVTADKSRQINVRVVEARILALPQKFVSRLRALITGSHPDNYLVQIFEVLCGILFGIMALRLMQISFFGVALAFIMLPIMHHLSWDNPIIKRFAWLPFTLILLGTLLGGLSLAGMQTVFFGYGFHF